MKTKHLFFTLVMVFFFSATNATIRTVSNYVNSPGQYFDFASAHAAANPGDTIYLHGSPYNYGSISISKQLVIIGTGHNPQKQAPLRSFLDYIYFYTGSSGTKIIGLDIYMTNTENQSINNVEIRLCKFGYRIFLDEYYCNNWIIDGNVFSYTNDNINGSYGQSGHRIRNNIFNGQLVNLSNANGYHYIENNIFLGTIDAFYNVSPAYANNNVFYRSNPGGGANGITYSNNISYQCSNNTFPNGTNQTNVDPQFTNFPNAGANFSYSYDFKINVASPAHFAGTDATDLGVYGGVGDFEQNGIPRIPYIASFNISNPTVAPGGTLNVTFKSKIR